MDLRVTEIYCEQFQIQRDWATQTQPLSVNFVCPSVTPDTDVNPTFRVYLYNRTTFEVATALLGVDGRCLGMRAGA